MKSSISSLVVHSSALAAAMLALAACQKNDLDEVFNDRTVKYAVAFDEASEAQASGVKSGVPASGSVFTLSDASGSLSIPMGLEVSEGISCIGASATKGDLVNTDGSDKELSDKGLTSFTASAYNGTEAVFSGQTVTHGTSGWSTANTYYWPQATDLTFYASTNLPSVEGAASVAATSAGQTLTYDVSKFADAAAQTDILLGSYHGGGGADGTAMIKFRHPLTAVSFKSGDIHENYRIKSIRLKGIARSGTAAMVSDGTFSWTPGTFDLTLGQAISTQPTASSPSIGDPFLFIPRILKLTTPQSP